MTTKELIPKHNGFHRPKVQTIVFVRHNGRGIAGSPQYYSKDSRTDGSVTLTEYSNGREYCSHREKLFRAVAKHHASVGKRAGCECETCK